MTIDKGQRRISGEESKENISQIESKCQTLLADVAKLQVEAANSAILLSEECKKKLLELQHLQEQLAIVTTELKEKETNDVRELSQIYEARFSEDMSRLIQDHISIPEAKLKKYSDQLMIRLEPGPSGGVRAILSFSSSMCLSDLQFTIQSVGDSAFSVTDCDPMVIGLSDLVDRLNSDNRSGSLARFCCRLRATYTAQYSTSI